MTTFARRSSVALAVVAAFLFAFTAGARADKQALMKQHLVKAAKALEQEDFKRAEQEFEEVLKLDPSSSDALELREHANVQFFIQAVTKGSPKMREGALKLLQLAGQAEKERLTDRNRIAKMIQDLLGPFEVRTAAYIGLASAGRYAVPQLLAKLVDTEDVHYKTYRVRVKRRN